MAFVSMKMARAALAPTLIYCGKDDYRQNGMQVCGWARCGQVLA
jgi:hypothetical protein